MVDAGTIYSEVRVELSKLDGDIRSVVAKFDQIAAESLKTTQTVAQSWDKVQTSVGNIDKTYQGLKGTYDTVGQKQQAVLASIKELIDKGIDPENGRVLALKQQYNDLQSQSDKTKAASESQQKKLEGLKSAYENITVAVTAAIAFAMKLVDAWAGAEQAAVRLDAATKLAGGSFGESKNLIDYGEELQKTSGFEHELTQNLMAQAALMGRSEDQTKELALAATQLANAGVMPLEEAFTQLSVTYDGMAPRSKVLKALIGDLSDEELRNGKAVDEIVKKTAGMNDIMMNTTAGGLKSLKNAFGELAESSGRILSMLGGPALKPLADLVNKLADFVDKTAEFRAAQVAYANGTATLNQQLIISQARYEGIINRLQELADKQNNGVELSKKEKEEYFQLQIRMTEWGAAIKDLETQLNKQGAAVDQQAQARKAALAIYENELSATKKLLDNGLIPIDEAQNRNIESAQKYAEALTAAGYTITEDNIGGRALKALVPLLEDLKRQLDGVNEDVQNITNKTWADYAEAVEKATKNTRALADEMGAIGTAGSMKAFVDANQEAIKSADEHNQKIKEIGASDLQLIEIEKARKIAEIEASAASEDAKQKEIDAVNEYYKKLEDDTASKKFLKSMSKTADTIADYFSNLLDAVIALSKAQADAQIKQVDRAEKAQEAALDAQMQAAEEAAGVAEETEAQKYQRELDDAIATGDAINIKTAQDNLTRYNIEQQYAAQKAAADADYEKQKAQIQYSADHEAWSLTRLAALADAARAIINIWSTWAWNPIVAGIMSGAAAIVTGIQISAIDAAEPQLPSYETGGIVLPASGGGRLVRVAENGSAELMLNAGPQGEAFMELITDKIASKLEKRINAGGTVTSILNVDGKKMAEVTARYFNKGITRLDR